MTKRLIGSRAVSGASAPWRLRPKVGARHVRLSVGLLLAVVVAAAIWWLPRAALLVVAALIVIWGAYEWAGLVAARVARWLYPLICAAFALWLWLLMGSSPDRAWLFAAVLWWLAMTALVAAFSNGFCARAWFSWALWTHFVVAAAAFWHAVADLHLLHRGWLLYVVLLTAACDVAAYYAGRRFGRRKLCPDLSPGKTREGLFGALAAAFALGALAASLYGLDVLDAAYFVLLTLFVCLMGVVGDLAVSMAKRRAGVKDSGRALPGHGGVLDRLDSQLAAAPVFLLGLSYL